MIFLGYPFAGDFYACDEEETEEGEKDGGADMHVGGGSVLADELFEELRAVGPADVFDFRELGAYDGCHVAPRPYFDEGADDEAGEDYEGFLVPAGEEPVEEFGEGEYSADCSNEEDGQYQEVGPEVLAADEAGDGAHDVLIFPEDKEDEASGDAGKDHCADGYRAAEEDEPECVRGLGRG